MSSGRKKDPIWLEFKQITHDNKKGSRAICKACNQEMQGLVGRLKSHREKCRGEIESDPDDPDVSVEQEIVDADTPSVSCKFIYLTSVLL